MKRAIWTAAAVAAALLGSAAQAQTVVFYPSYGNYGPLWSGTLVNNRGAFGALNWQQARIMPGYGGVPLAGLNSPPVGRSETRRATFRGEGQAVRSAATRRGNRDAGRLENLMSERPLISGTVIRVGATGVSVRVEEGRKTRNVRYNQGEVFFFRGGDLTSSASSPDVLQPGDRVLVPQPE